MKHSRYLDTDAGTGDPQGEQENISEYQSWRTLEVTSATLAQAWLSTCINSYGNIR
jgi:hypothetical protein